jgi:hypothetical protein
MPAYLANLINAFALVFFGGWGYFASSTPSPTALIPAAGGLILGALTPWVRAQSKHPAHAAAALTLLLVLALAMPLRSALGRADYAAAARVGAMLLIGLVALAAFYASFRAARRARAAAAQAAAAPRP